MTAATVNRRDTAPAPLPAAVPAFNVGKLLDMREAHDRMHEDYRRLAERARTARAEVAHLRHAALTDPTNEAQLAAIDLPADKLAEVASDELRDLGLEVQTVRRIVHGQARADALKGEAQALAAKLADSRRLLDSLNTYAGRWPGSL